MKAIPILIAIFLTLVISQSALALNVVSINTEWFWDSEPPHEGKNTVFGAKGRPPSMEKVELEAYAIALQIQIQDAEVVGLSEIEGEGVVKRVMAYLPKSWSYVFKKGRDNSTGQDVAILTKFSADPSSVRIDPPKASFGSAKNKRPSKIIGAAITLDDGRKIYVIQTHFISKRGNNDEKRAAQAISVTKLVTEVSKNYAGIILMGDLNDVPGSETLNILLDSGLNMLSAPSDYSYTDPS